MAGNPVAGDGPSRRKATYLIREERESDLDNPFRRHIRMLVQDEVESAVRFESDG